MPASWLSKYGYGNASSSGQPQASSGPSWTAKYGQISQSQQPMSPAFQNALNNKANPAPTISPAIQNAQNIKSMQSMQGSIVQPNQITQSPKNIFEKIGVSVGKLLQKTPDANLGTKGQKTFKATDTETKMVNFLSNFPSSVAQSWGKSLELVSTDKGRTEIKQGAKDLPKTMSEVKTHIDKGEWQQAFNTAFSNPAISVALDVSDFIPVVGLAGKGIKTGLRQTAKQIVKEALEEGGQTTIAKAPKASDIIFSNGQKESTQNPQSQSGQQIKAGQTEIPQVKRGESSNVTQPKVSESATPQEKVSKLGLKVEQTAIEKKLTSELSDLPTYKTMNMKEQAQKSADLINSDPDKAFKIALGLEEPPAGVQKESIFKAIENSITTPEQAVQLAKSPLVSEASQLGQRIKALDVKTSESPVEAIRQVLDARAKHVEGRLGKPTDKATQKIVSDIKSTVKTPSKYDWSAFVESIKC